MPGPFPRPLWFVASDTFTPPGWWACCYLCGHVVPHSTEPAAAADLDEHMTTEGHLRVLDEFTALWDRRR